MQTDGSHAAKASRRRVSWDQSATTTLFRDRSSSTIDSAAAGERTDAWWIQDTEHCTDSIRQKGNLRPAAARPDKACDDLRLTDQHQPAQTHCSRNQTLHQNLQDQPGDSADSGLHPGTSERHSTGALAHRLRLHLTQPPQSPVIRQQALPESHAQSESQIHPWL